MSARARRALREPVATRGNWLRLFGVVLAVAAGVVSSLISVGGTAVLGGRSLALQFANSGVSYAVSLVPLGVLAEAFCRLRAERDPRPDPAVT